tara:strand:+ start:7564 stop:8457 length:894 start_codon:yes stop_codon:yes gene_type:complete
MSRLRADEVLSKDALGPFLATEGMNVPAGKSITFNDASEPTVLTGTTLTTTTVNADQINLDDNQKLRIGQDQDLEIYHDGSDSYISERGEGLLSIDSSFIRLRNSLGTKKLATFSPGTDSLGGVQLFYDNSKKFETNATGAAVTGTLTGTGGWAGTTSSAGVLGGLAMAFTCGINGRIGLPAVNSTMVFGGSEFQGGTDNTQGAVMPYAGKLYAATVHSENQIQSLRLALSINGDTTNTTNTLEMNGNSTAQNFSVIEDWGASPVTFAAGDRVNFRVSYTTVTQLEVVTVTFFVKFD